MAFKDLNTIREMFDEYSSPTARTEEAIGIHYALRLAWTREYNKTPERREYHATLRAQPEQRLRAREREAVRYEKLRADPEDRAIDNARKKAWREANPDKHAASKKAWAEANREKSRAHWHKWNEKRKLLRESQNNPASQ